MFFAGCAVVLALSVIFVGCIAWSFIKDMKKEK